MSKTKTGFLVVGIIIVAAFLRLHHFKTTPPGLYPDEAVNAYNAATANRTGDYKVYYPENNGREGLFMNVQAMSLKFFGVNEPWSLRFPSPLFGILTVLGIFLLGRELFGARVGLLASFFAATNFWHINFSRIGFRAITAPFFLTFAMFFLLWAYRKAREGSKISTVGLIAAIGGVFFGLGFYSYIAYRVAPLLLILFWVFFRKAERFWKIMLTFLIVTFIVALPIGIYYLQHPADFLGRTAQVSVFSAGNPIKILAVNIAKTIGMFFVYGDPNWRHNYATRPELFWPVSIMFLIGIIWLVRALLRRNKSEFSPAAADPALIRFAPWFLSVWLGLMALPVVTSNEGIPHALRAIVMVPPVMILAGLGGIAFYDFLKRRYHGPWLNIPLAIILSLLIFQAYNMYFDQWAVNPNVSSAFAADYTVMARQIRELAKTQPVYIVADGGGIDAMIADPQTGAARKVGFPLATQVIMFMTDTFTPEDQQAKHIYYLTPDQAGEIPTGAKQFIVR